MGGGDKRRAGGTGPRPATCTLDVSAMAMTEPLSDPMELSGGQSCAVARSVIRPVDGDPSDVLSAKLVDYGEGRIQARPQPPDLVALGLFAAITDSTQGGIYRLELGPECVVVPERLFGPEETSLSGTA